MVQVRGDRAAVGSGRDSRQSGECDCAGGGWLVATTSTRWRQH